MNAYHTYPMLQSKRTKIVATLSDRRCDEQFVRRLFEAGMDVVRINSAHVTEASAQRIVETVRRVSDSIAVILDTKGPEIRVTGIAEEYGGAIAFRAGERVRVRGTAAGEMSTRELIYMNVPTIVQDIPVGAHMLIADGELEIRVVEKTDEELLCEFLVGGSLRPRKSVNAPGVAIDLPPLTEKDRRFIEWAVGSDVDFIAHSFVRSARDVEAVQEILNRHGSPIKIISKIENQEGIDHIDEIIEASYGIMVARGDLGIEIAPELVPHVQKEIIAKCNAAYKPVITATQMLDSMQHNPRPTRAEVADVANAIYDGTDAVMLSGETAAGKYPVEAVKMQASIAAETEKYLPEHAPLKMPENAHGTRVINNVVGMSAVNMAATVGAKCITVPTTTGRTARLISHFRPKMPILAFSRHDWAVQQMIMYWGVEPHLAAITQGTVNGTIMKSIETAKELGFVQEGDLTVATAGDPRMSVQLDGKATSTNVAYVAQVR